MTMPKRLERALRQIVAEVDAMPDPPAVLTTCTAVVADHLAAEDRRRARHDAAQAHRDAKAQQGGRMWSRRRQDPPELEADRSGDEHLREQVRKSLERQVKTMREPYKSQARELLKRCR